MKPNKIIKLVVVGLLVMTTAVFAHQGATGIIKQRMDSMSEMGDAMKVMADMIKGKREFSTEVIASSTEILEKHSRMLLEYFPNTDESRDSKDSDALPVIWESWDRFEELSNGLELSVSDLEDGIKKGLDKRSFRMVFSKTAKSCSSCHDDYRRPKE